MHIDATSQTLFLKQSSLLGITYQEGLQGQISHFFKRSIKIMNTSQTCSCQTLYLSKKSIAEYIFTTARKEKASPPKKVHDYFIAHIEKVLTAVENDGKLESEKDLVETISFLVDHYFNNGFKGFLYKVKQDGEVKGYLLGTCHMGTHEMSILNYKIKSALLKSETLFLEHKVSLWDHAKAYFTLSSKVQNLLMKTIQDFESLGAKSAWGHEEQLLKVCEAGSIACESLETMDEQLEALSAIEPFCDDEANINTFVESGREVFYSVREGKWQMLTSSILEMESNEKYAPSAEKLFWSRNRKMAKRAAEHFQKASNEKRIMIAIGAGHLPTDRGVITNLQERGFTVQRVST